MAKHVLTKIKDALQSLSESRDTNYLKVEVPWKHGTSFSVECERYTIGPIGYGEPVGYAVYYRVKGKDVDCCTIYYWPDEQQENFLREFVKMYE